MPMRKDSGTRFDRAHLDTTLSPGPRSHAPEAALAIQGSASRNAETQAKLTDATLATQRLPRPTN
jgi:hypothetical protein